MFNFIVVHSGVLTQGLCLICVCSVAEGACFCSQAPEEASGDDSRIQQVAQGPSAQSLQGQGGVRDARPASMQTRNRSTTARHCQC